MDLSIQTLRIFCKVVENGSFSQAARALKITQPTVSQQIARIEQSVNGKLFERVGKSIHLTPIGQEFHSFAKELVEKSDQFSEHLKDQRSLPTGLVKYAMPESCQWTPHYRKIMSRIREFPGIRFEIEILPNSAITQLLLEGKLDFGFVSGERLNPELRFEKFSDEHYSLVAADKKLFAPLSEKNLSELRLISFPGWELFFETWAKTNGLWDSMRSHMSLPTVRVGTLAGAIHAVQEGAGVAAIPTHCIATELEAKGLYAFPKLRAKEPTNPVHVVRRTGEKLSRRAELVLEMLRSAKAEFG